MSWVFAPKPESFVGQGLIEPAVVARFLASVQMAADENGCWYWTRPLTRGYGTFQIGKDIHGVDRGRHLAHRAAYLLFVDEITREFDVDHQCHTAECRAAKACLHRACVRPDHLKLLSRGDNIRRGAGRWDGLTCKQGHLWTEDNTLRRKDGSRICRTCAYERNNASYARRTAGRVPAPHHNALKTHCPRGHEYSPENTVIRPNGSRACRTCQRLANQRSKAKRRAH